MASNMRRGKIPHSPQGTGEYLDEVYTLGGFFGDWAHIFRHGNMGQPLQVVRRPDDVQRDRLGRAGRHRRTAAPPGRRSRCCAGTALRWRCHSEASRCHSPSGTSTSTRSASTTAADFELETELGPLEMEEGDFAVIPQGHRLPRAPAQAGRERRVRVRGRRRDHARGGAVGRRRVLELPDRLLDDGRSRARASTPRPRSRSRPTSASGTAASTTPSPTRSIRARTWSAGSGTRSCSR